MAEKPHGQAIQLLEQIIEDEVTGITFKIERIANGEGRIRLYGNIPFGHRDLAFDPEGRLVGMGTCMVPNPVGASWLSSG